MNILSINKKKVAIYTAIIGDYDYLLDPTFISDSCDYIVFTNKKNLKSTVWKIINISDERLSNVLLARRLKILGHPTLSDYETTIWVDANIDITADPADLVSEQHQNEIFTFKHSSRNCIYEEAEACKNLKKDQEYRINEQITFLRKQGYPENNGLIESGVLIRKNNAITYQLMTSWWAIVSSYSHRDQLSFNYVHQKHNIKIRFIGEPEKKITSKWFRIRANHALPLVKTIKKKIINILKTMIFR